jgi:hypothetical protein
MTFKKQVGLRQQRQKRREQEYSVSMSNKSSTTLIRFYKIEYISKENLTRIRVTIRKEASTRSQTQ